MIEERRLKCHCRKIVSPLNCKCSNINEGVVSNNCEDLPKAAAFLRSAAWAHRVTLKGYITKIKYINGMWVLFALMVTSILLSIELIDYWVDNSSPKTSSPINTDAGLRFGDSYRKTSVTIKYYLVNCNPGVIVWDNATRGARVVFAPC